MARPLIGITADVTTATWDHWARAAAVLSVDYFKQVAAAGGVPVILVPDLNSVADIVGRLNGLVLSGGGDIHPNHYGEQPDTRLRPADPLRDEWEFLLVRHALQTDLPVLGICRGMQLLNVALGGTLVQHLPDVVGSHRHLPHRSGFGYHRISTRPGSLLHDALGPQADIATHHHQAVAHPGDGVIATAWADDDVVEGLEVDAFTWVCGIQGHPEESSMTELFAALVRASQLDRVGA